MGCGWGWGWEKWSEILWWIKYRAGPRDWWCGVLARPWALFHALANRPPASLPCDRQPALAVEPDRLTPPTDQTDPVKPTIANIYEQTNKYWKIQ